MADYKSMTVPELEAAIHAINEKEAAMREEKRAIHAVLNEKMPAHLEEQNEGHQREAMDRETQSAVAEAANITSSSASAEGS